MIISEAMEICILTLDCQDNDILSSTMYLYINLLEGKINVALNKPVWVFTLQLSQEGQEDLHNICLDASHVHPLLKTHTFL